MLARYSKSVGGLYGALVGDACGVPYEFKAPGMLPSFDNLDMVPPAGFKRTWANIPVGTYSDDGAQILCLLEVLIESGGSSIDHKVLFTKLYKWLREGYMSVDNLTFDVGNQTSSALQWPEEITSLDNPRFNGNGSLMRSLPAALVSTSEQQVCEVAWKHSGVTHPHMRARLCCVVYSLIAYYMIEGEQDVFKASDKAFARAKLYVASMYPTNTSSPVETVVAATWNIKQLTEEIEYIQQFEHNECTGSGYVIDCLWTAIKVINVSETYEQAIKRAIAYGNDTDTTACVAGGLAGIKFGKEGIPSRWLELLRGKEGIEHLAIRMMMFQMRGVVANITPENIARELISVQPIDGPTDWDALAEAPLWQSFCNRHFEDEDK